LKIESVPNDRAAPSECKPMKNMVVTATTLPTGRLAFGRPSAILQYPRS